MLDIILYTVIVFITIAYFYQRSNCHVKYNVRDEIQHMTAKEIYDEYTKNANSCAVACLNLQGNLNTGTMIRTSTIYNIGKFFILGRTSFDSRSAVGTNHHMPVEKHFALTGTYNEFFNDNEIINILTELQNKYAIIFIEQHPNSMNIKYIKNTLAKPPLFVFGNESTGIPKKIMEMPNTIICEIEQPGTCRSFNVSTACGIILYEYFRDKKCLPGGY
jgi:tRNA G18 (ribose-2'-O)-methylase SpoU